MPNAADKLTAHFTWGELGIDRSGVVAPFQYWPNVRRLADYLEVVRAELGVPLNASGYRSPARNETVGGSDTSSHLTGEAADVVPVGMNVLTAYTRLKSANAAGRLPAFDQIIYYPFQHLHIGLGPRARRQFLLRVKETNSYALDTSAPPPATTTEFLADDSGLPSNTTLLVLGAAVVLLIIFATA